MQISKALRMASLRVLAVVLTVRCSKTWVRINTLTTILEPLLVADTSVSSELLNAFVVEDEKELTCLVASEIAPPSFAQHTGSAWVREESVRSLIHPDDPELAVFALCDGHDRNPCTRGHPHTSSAIVEDFGKELVIDDSNLGHFLLL